MLIQAKKRLNLKKNYVCLQNERAKESALQDLEACRAQVRMC